MSAFVVGPETIDRIITHLACNQRAVSMRDDLIAAAKVSPANWTQELGAALWSMNVRAVNCRYCRYSQRMRTPVYAPQTVLAPPMQVLKSMSCLQYQCDEGNVPNSKLYQALERAKGALAFDIAADTKEWAAARWM